MAWNNTCSCAYALLPSFLMPFHRASRMSSGVAIMFVLFVTTSAADEVRELAALCSVAVFPGLTSPSVGFWGYGSIQR